MNVRFYCLNPARKVFLRSFPGLLLGLLLTGFGAQPVFAQRPYGIDVSDYQGSGIDWPTVKSSGVSFAWAKATEGLTLNDTSFAVNEVNAKAAGVLIGAYHFAHPETHLGTAGADVEAAHFWGVASNYIKSGGSYLQPMLDVESSLSSASPPYTKATLSQWVNEWCQDIVNYAAASGVAVKPVVYTYTSYATTWLDSTVTNWPLWMAAYPASPQPQTGAPGTSPWPTWAVWQYNDTNTTFSGVSSSCDVDVFNGTAAGLSTLTIVAVNAPFFTSQPGDSRVSDTGGSITFSATAGGGLPLSYQWKQNGTNIPGATSATLTIVNAQTANTGSYALTVTNISGSATSSSVSLIVYPLQATVFSDAFDADTSGSWVVNQSSADTAVAFNFDYSTLGIPSAPHSAGGTTRGVQLKANLTQGLCSALSISPANQNFSGDYRLHFDGWINVNGPFPGGGASSTEFLTFGIGTSGSHVQWTTNSSADGYYFSADGDGGVSSTSTTFGDYAGYIGKNWQNAATGIYPAGSLDNTNAYYTNAIPATTVPPALQQANYPKQTGSLSIGSFGLAWHDVIVSRRGNTVDWSVDGVRMCTICNATFITNNIFVGFWDPFASLTDNTNLSFGLVDNVRVEVPAVAPGFITQPQSRTVRYGTNVTFTATVTGLPAPNYQWSFNGTNISGATNASILISGVTSAKAGTYSVTVTNIAGAVTSTNATLALVPPAAAVFNTISLQAGAVQIGFSGDPYWPYTIETSTNLFNWTTFTNLTSTNGVFNFSAGPASSSAQQFYRARVGP